MTFTMPSKMEQSNNKKTRRERIDFMENNNKKKRKIIYISQLIKFGEMERNYFWTTII